MKDGCVTPGGAKVPGGWAGHGAANRVSNPAAVVSLKEQFVMVHPSEGSPPAPLSGVAIKLNARPFASEAAVAVVAPIADRLSEQIDAHDSLDRGQEHRQVVVERQCRFRL